MKIITKSQISFSELLDRLKSNSIPSNSYEEARKSVQSRNFIPYCALRIIEEKVSYIVVLGKHKTQPGPLVYLDSDEYGIGCLDLSCVAYHIEELEEKLTKSDSFVCSPYGPEKVTNE